ncbi:MAG: hypothetical protein Q9193_003720 [Seirophora villosa]
MLATQFDDYGKGANFLRDWEEFLGHGIFTTDEEEWAKSRQLLRPQFIKTRVRDFDIFEKHVQRLLLLLDRQGKEVDVSELFNGAFAKVQSIQNMRMRAGPLKHFVPLREFRKSLRTIDAFIEPFIQDALRYTPEELDEKETRSIEDTTLLRSVAKFTRDRQVIRDQIVNILLAGRDSTAATLSFLFKELSAHPNVHSKLRQEILEKIGPHETPTFEDLKEMQYLQHCISETLRLYSVVPFNMRVALKDTTLPLGGGVDGLSPVGVKKDTLIGYSTWFLHRNQAHYPPVSAMSPPATEFSPERWETWVPRPWQYIPFNGGPRICIGQQFALTEIGYTTVRILQRFGRLEKHWGTSEDKVKTEIVLLPAYGVKFLISFAKHIVEVPRIRLFELAACHAYYQQQHDAVGHGFHDNLDDRLCKVPAVQNELSTLTGWQFAFDAVPGLLLAIYYGSIAGKYGRKPVLLLFSTGMLLSLAWTVLVCWLAGRVPVRLIWLSSLFILIGGGQRVAKAMLFTIVSDTVEASHRTRYMSFLSSIPHITTLITPPLSAIFMKINIWLPFEAAMGAVALTFALILAMPESSKIEAPGNDDGVIARRRDPEPLAEDHRPLLSTIDSGFIPPAQIPSSPKPSPWYTEIAHLLRIPSLRFCFTVFLVAPIALVAKAFVYQHASESFGWEMSTTTWLRVSQAIGASLVTLFALPTLNALLHRYGLRAQQLDLGVLRGSLLVGAAGFAVLWQAKVSWVLLLALFICGLSEAIQPTNQGLATSLITREYNARLFTTVAVLETVGKLAGGPVQSVLFSIGRKSGHGSLGINFMASSGIFGSLFVLALVVRVKR